MASGSGTSGSAAGAAIATGEGEARPRSGNGAATVLNTATTRLAQASAPPETIPRSPYCHTQLGTRRWRPGDGSFPGCSLTAVVGRSLLTS